jgi:NADPH2:quinone reductase
MLDVLFPTTAGDEILIRVQYAGVNFIDTYFRSGVYPLPTIPWTAGSEAAGIIEQLPTDSAVLNDPEFKARNYQVGQTVAFVCAGWP